ncbi:unnamed protein product, partial [Rotaria sp. Silwood1]
MSNSQLNVFLDLVYPNYHSYLDPTQCDCIDNTFYYGVNQGGGSLLCLPCNSTYIRSSDGFGCVTTNISCGLTWPESVK